jgi:hypothetical protein
VKEYVAALVGVPVRFNDVVVLEALATMPDGSAPEEITHLYGVQPPLALTAPEYGVPTVPLGREVVVMAMPDIVAWITTLYALCEVPPPHAVTFTVKEYVAAFVGVPLMFKDVVVLDVFAMMPGGTAPDASVHL